MSFSPFRYPGGKGKMLPVLMEYIDSILKDGNSFCDAFVGGGSVALEVANKYPKSSIFLNDKDYNIYCFWKIIADSDINKLNELLQLMTEQPTIELFYKLRGTPANSDVESAYRGIFFNRTTFSGIAYSGPIGGKDQNSKYTVDCRYNFKKLKEKMLKCNKLLSGRTVVSNEDFSTYSLYSDASAVLYCDPPYFQKGDILYVQKMNDEQHKILSGLLNKRSNWILSYDDCPEIRDLYKSNKIIDFAVRYSINGEKSSWQNKNELIILP